MEWLSLHALDAFTTMLGLLYIWLEYRVSIWLWLVGIVMPALDIILYWTHGLYGDSFMAMYYTLAGIYGWLVWKYGSKHTQESTSAISYMSADTRYKALCFFVVAWAGTWYILEFHTDSKIPVLDAFTNAMSFVALWALSRKHIEQWLLWIAVDVVSCYLYIIKDVPFKAGLYGLYVIIAIAGYLKWKQLMHAQESI